MTIPVTNTLWKLFAAVVLLGAASMSARAEDPAQDDRLNAALWSQTSVEHKATALSVYAGAQRLLDEAISDRSWTADPEQGAADISKPPAIILDLDETVLDNSAYQSWMVTAHTSYSGKTWATFVNEEISIPIPGALALTKAAAAKDVTVFYVSNRKAPQEKATVANLKKYGFPFADTDHVMLRGEQKEWGSAKGTRRAVVAKNYRTIMMFGDNFGDFVDDMGGDIKGRIAVMNKYKNNWGQRWFMLPNPTYGSWESAAFNGEWSKSAGERRQDKLNALDSWVGPKQ